MTAQDVVEFWLAGANDALKTAEELMIAERYHHALFFCHLAVEKMLKSVYVTKIGNVPPPLHNLLLLTDKAKIKLPEATLEQLREINTFNVEARYDDYKLKFYKKATKDFSEKWFSVTKKLLLWLKSI
ncbi:TPA: DNA-binding protein [Patescibacteria group bacterium]|uniref:HEPN domain-containing protein n=1 Tax=Candidatus Gottesmanbacteria bacterium GW2011_GWA1_43_11 TaxID=1618436 RepID=A0A0G1F7I5_9BACT|nr:MAG: hypothetical protein UV59_C0053G0005 [Candidatus Gottesmanbacteria bacterium GW2011_GWA1_43_11]HCS78698.1 DNA-binding protein [Patescibacteria group bacterium]